ncbi:MAG: hypothetical protein IT236_10680 [Bacteroidia bacterium]|nr:hypothetical protein [Bacteroidia bacterium]
MQPELSPFLTQLFDTGTVTIKNTLFQFSEEDILLAKPVLKNAWHKRVNSLPPGYPEYNEEAALWSACLLYKLLQFILIRNLEAEEMENHLMDYTGEKNASVMLSADLCLRHLPVLFGYARALSPDDPLLQKIKRIAAEWPYSSVGSEIPEVKNEDLLVQNKSLFADYIDAVIFKQDKTRIGNPIVKNGIETALGQHTNVLWPNFNLLLPLTTLTKNETREPENN